MMFFYSIVMLLHDFVEAYIEEPYNNLKGFFNAIWTILTDIKFWLVFCIIILISIIPFGILLTQQEKIAASKIEAHIILHDGREFKMKKSEIYEHAGAVTFKTENGEEITTTLYTITYKHNN